MQTNRELVVEPIGLDVETLPRPIDWRELFGNENPVEIEIGMGKGTFLTEQAKARPEVNFFGIEWARLFWRYASDRLRRSGCTNAPHRSRGGELFPERVRRAGERLRPAHLFPRPLAQSPPPQATARSSRSSCRSFTAFSRRRARRRS